MKNITKTLKQTLDVTDQKKKTLDVTEIGDSEHETSLD